MKQLRNIDNCASQIDAAVGTHAFHNLHSVIVQQAGKTLLERYYRGNDSKRGHPLGVIEFSPTVLHDLRSVTKSIVSLLYGIALAAGKVAPPEAVLVTQFRDYGDLAADPARRQMTVAHALTMTIGTEWDEDAPYTGPWNSEIAMNMAGDRNRFILDRPLQHKPGSTWLYNGGTTALLSDLIERGSGQNLLSYAKEALFQPLGIADVEWVCESDGRFAAASGLRLLPRDLAKIGRLILQQGKWEGEQVVPASWLQQSFEPQASIDENFSYGYQWWLGRFLESDGHPWIAGNGNGGQRLIVLPHLDLVVVIMTGNYDQPDQSDIPVALMRDIILPAVTA